MTDEPTLKTVLGFVAALLVPIVGAIASFVSRTGTQRRLQEIDLRKARLDLLEKTVAVGQTISNTLKASIDLSTLKTEYLRIVVSIPEPEPPSPGQPMPFEESPLPIRIFLLPRPASLTGWMLSAAFYLFLFYLVIFVVLYAGTIGDADRLDLVLKIFVLCACAVVIWFVRYLAIRSARTALVRAREKYDRDTARVAEARRS
jgi:hypothetical protein